MTGLTHNNKADYVPKHAVRVDSSGCASTQEHGSIEIDFCDMVLRIHNGCANGGVALVPMIGNCEEGTVGMISNRAPEPQSIPEGSTVLNVEHKLGYIPLVQLLDADNVVVQAEKIEHSADGNSTMITQGKTVATKLILR